MQRAGTCKARSRRRRDAGANSSYISNPILPDPGGGRLSLKRTELAEVTQEVRDLSAPALLILEDLRELHDPAGPFVAAKNEIDAANAALREQLADAQATLRACYASLEEQGLPPLEDTDDED